MIFIMFFSFYRFSKTQNPICHAQAPLKWPFCIKASILPLFYRYPADSIYRSRA